MCSAGGSVKWGSGYGKHYGSFSKCATETGHVVQQFHVWRTTHKRTESRDANRHLDTLVHSSRTDHSPKVGTTQVPIGRCMDTQNVKLTYSRMLFSLIKKGVLTHATVGVILEDVLLSEIRQPRKYKDYDSTRMRSLQESNS